MEELIGLNAGIIYSFGALIGMQIIFAVIDFVLGVSESILFQFSCEMVRLNDLDFGKIN